MKRRAQTELIDSNLAPKFWTDVQISLPSIPRQAEAGAERLTKYFSDANVENFVRGASETGSRGWRNHPSGTLASCQTPATDLAPAPVMDKSWRQPTHSHTGYKTYHKPFSRSNIFL